MHILLDIFLPRFVTDECAAILDRDGIYHVVCLVDELTPDAVYTDIITVRSFNLFGFALFPYTLVEDDKPL